MATLDTIQKVLNENLDIEPETVTVDATLEGLGIDSLDMAELICSLEEELDIDSASQKASRPSASWSPISKSSRRTEQTL